MFARQDRNPQSLLKHAVIAVLLLSLSSTTLATVYYTAAEDPAANDSNPGTEALPWKTIQKGADTMQPGDTLRIKRGTYRETVTIHTSGAPGAYITYEVDPADAGSVVIKGSDKYQNWQAHEGAIYSLPWPYEYWGYGTDIGPGYGDELPFISRQEQVFQDGVLLTHVQYYSELKEGSYYLDYENHANKHLYVWLNGNKNPNQENAEASSRECGIVTSANNTGGTELISYVKIKGLKLTHFASRSRNSGGIVLINCDNWIVEDNEITWSNYPGIEIGANPNAPGRSHLTFKRNAASHNGCIGIAGGASDSLFEDNITDANNYKGHDLNNEAAGMKLCVMTNTIVRRHIARDNNGTGIWLDIGVYYSVIENCFAHNNALAGIFNEISARNIIVSNVVCHTRSTWGAGVGILNSSSASSHICNNISYANSAPGNGNTAPGIGVCGDGTRAWPDLHQATTFDPDCLNRSDNISLYFTSRNNVVEKNIVSGFSFYNQTNPDNDRVYGNTFSQNLYFANIASTPFILGDNRFSAVSLPEWRSANDRDVDSLVGADPLFVDPENHNFTLQPGSPATGLGFDSTGMRLDWTSYVPPVCAPVTASVPGGHGSVSPPSQSIYMGGSGSIYLNGTLVGTGTGTLVPFSGSLMWVGGCNGYTGNDYADAFKGYMDDVEVYSSSLNLLTLHMNEGTGLPLDDSGYANAMVNHGNMEWGVRVAGTENSPCMKFNRSALYTVGPVTTMLQTSGVGDFSLASLVNLDALPQWICGLFCHEAYLTSGFRAGINFDRGLSFWTTQSGGTIDVRSSSALLQLGDWNHIEFRYNAGNAVIDITPDPNYCIAAITDNGLPQTIANPYIIYNVAEPHNVAVTFGAPTVNVTSPAEGAVIAGNSLTVTASADGQSETITKVVFYGDGVEIGTDTTVPYSIVWNNVVGGSHVLKAVAYGDRGGVTTSSAVNIKVWNTQDINTSGGSASYANGVFTVTGKGAGITGTADGFRFVYQQVSGDCTIVARITSRTGTKYNNGRVGVMVRQDTTSGAKEASSLFKVYSANEYAFHCRTATSGGTTKTYVAANTSAPWWVKLVRVGNTVTAHKSTNGTNWSKVGSTTTISMNNPIQVGLVITSGSTSTANTATIDNVTITTP